MNTVPFPAMKRPLIAILRGLKPEEAEGVVSVLIEHGMTAIEIPLNSPDWQRSIGDTVAAFGTRALIGAGTVLTENLVDEVADLGGRLVVTPNTDETVMPSLFSAVGKIARLVMAARTPAAIAHQSALFC